MTALHGFLGRSDDWSDLLGPDWTCPDWGRTFPNGMAAKAAELNEALPGGTLMGYSMGGRLALSMLFLSVGLWDRAILISASPGLTDEPERETRRNSDAAWAKRFQGEPWESVIADWNGQPVFAHDPPDRLPRLEEEFDRATLVRLMADGSVGHQPNFRTMLARLEIPILWIAGEHDAKYRALAEECAALNPRFESAILPGAGHRAPWGNPTAFREAVDRFITIKP